MKKIQILGLIFNLLVCCTSFAASLVGVINKTGTHVKVRYVKFNAHQHSDETGASNVWKDLSNLFALGEKQSLYISDAKEIEYPSGNTLPNGAKGHFPLTCSAKAGAIILYKTSSGVITCRIEE